MFGKIRRAGFVAAAVALGLTVSACGGDAGSGTAGDADKGTITLGFIPSWTDGLSTAHLLKNQLEADGYTVEFQTLSEAAPLYAGLSQGDVDIYPSAWPEVTHSSYMEQFGDRIEDLGAYYDNAKLTLAVPDYLDDVDSIEDLKGDNRFRGRIIGIEPGAGLTRVTEQEVMPQYELTGEYELVTSSTTAMLAELQKATDAEQPIVVTLWRPFWANSEFPVKDLEDPRGALGEPEGLHFLAVEGFTEEFPEVAEWIGQIKLDDDQYGSLEDMVVNEYGEGREGEAVQAWLDANPGVLPTLGG